MELITLDSEITALELKKNESQKLLNVYNNKLNDLRKTIRVLRINEIAHLKSYLFFESEKPSNKITWLCV